MIGDIIGYCSIKNPSDSIVTAGKREDYEKAMWLRCIDINDEGDVMCLAPDAESIAMIDKKDIQSIFKCSVVGECIVPPNLDFLQQSFYSLKLMGRKGGYNEIVKRMVIMASLHKGQYEDGFLFQKQ